MTSALFFVVLALAYTPDAATTIFQATGVWIWVVIVAIGSRALYSETYWAYG